MLTPVILTPAQRKSLELIRDTERPYEGNYRHNARQWDMWMRLVRRRLAERLASPARMRITQAGIKALAQTK